MYQNIKINTSRTLPDATEVGMTSRTINFSFSKYINDGFAKGIEMFTKVQKVPDAENIVEEITKLFKTEPEEE